MNSLHARLLADVPVIGGVEEGWLFYEDVATGRGARQKEFPLLLIFRRGG